MSIHAQGWQTVGAVGAAVVGVCVQLYIAYRTRQQTTKQSQDTLKIQRTVTERSAATFIAEKRQKWIDELRADMAAHLAISSEIVWKWDAVRSREATFQQESCIDVLRIVTNMLVKKEISGDSAISFVANFKKGVEKNNFNLITYSIDIKTLIVEQPSSSSLRDLNNIFERAVDQYTTSCRDRILSLQREFSENENRHLAGHTRIKLRLNRNEASHIELMAYLDGIRGDINGIRSVEPFSDLQVSIKLSEFQASAFKNIRDAENIMISILKGEWEKVKQEVAYPDELLALIPKPKQP
ncbi:hypothetical protein [Paraburkholderia sp. J67]|uniref:hypothetical protein n=1 Tax=Paraburkholderia sp. J67 TaxID=2805435 RepID=UPI002ABE1AC3|nr:hypothetical protein [Paraburkholderia sp. J67]